jgi:hypothetical protein
VTILILKPEIEIRVIEGMAVISDDSASDVEPVQKIALWNP